MSEQLADSGFTSQGFDGSVSFYGEEQMIHDYATESTANLEARISRFNDIIDNPNTIPKHRDHALRYLSHVAFELGYREGSL